MDENASIYIENETTVINSSQSEGLVNDIASISNVQNATEDYPIVEASEIIDIEVESAFPYASNISLDDTIEDRNILIDGGIAVQDENDDISLIKVLEDCATVGSGGVVNHAQLNGKDSSDAHPISAITGLSDELAELNRLKEVRTSEDICAIYYPWYDAYNGEDRTGYFVSYKAVDVGEVGGIIIADGETDVLGVTVRTAGYIGNDTQTTIDGITITRADDPNYGLVGFAGIVNVRSSGNIPVGSRVIPNEYGMAEATANESGFYVLAKGNNASYDFVTIYLGVNMDALAKLRSTIADDIGFTDEDKQRLEDAVTSAELAEVLSRIDELGVSVGDMGSQLKGTAVDIEELEKMIDEAKKATEAQQESMTQINKQIADTQQSIVDLDTSVAQKIDEARHDMQEQIVTSVSEVNADIDNAMTEIAVVVDNINNLNSNFREGGTIAQMQEHIDDNSARIDSIVGGNLADVLAITQIKQQVDENGGLIQSLVLDIQKYSLGEFSQSYGLKYEDAASVLVEGIIYVPSRSHSETMTKGEGDAPETLTYDFEVLSGLTYRYIWDGTGWIKGDPVSMSSSYFEYDGTTATTDMWFCQQDVVHTTTDDDGNISEELYEAGTLYAWRNNRWIAVASIRGSVSTRSISQVRQTAEAYAVQLQNLEGDFSQYKQTVDVIEQVVGGSDGEIGSMIVTKDGIVGEVYNPNGTATSLKAQVDANRAIIDLLASGYYHRLELSLSTPVPSPAAGAQRYSVRPEWSVKEGKFIFNEAYAADDGIYYFFDQDPTHYCKIIGDGYEVYTIGNIVTAGVDVNITEFGSTVDTLATFSNDTTSTLSAIRNKAIETEAKIENIASLSTNTLLEVVNDRDFNFQTTLYSDKPVWDSDAQEYVFLDEFINVDGLYFPGETADTFRKLIPDGNGGYIGYEVYNHDFTGTAGIVQQVLDNKSSIGMIVTADENGKQVNGGVLVSAINGQTAATIYGDKIDIKGITAFSSSSGSNTIINGSYITTGVIKSNNYSYSNGYYSNAGTAYDLTTGAITSKNYAIDASGNLHLRGTLDGTDAIFNGKLQGATGEFTGTVKAGELWLKDPDTKEYVNILTENNQIGSKWLESLSVEKLTTGYEDSYNIQINGRKIKFYNLDEVLIGQLYATSYGTSSGSTTLWSKQLRLAASDEVDQDLNTYPEISLYGSGIELWGTGGNTGIRINLNNQGKVQIYGTVEINDEPLTAKFG